MSDRNVLIISTVADVATDHVVGFLSRWGVEHRRVNTEDFPFNASLTLDFQEADRTSISLSGNCLPASAIWYRRMRSPPLPKGMDPGIYDFCLRENRAALLGGLQSQQARWMSAPTAVWKAEFKPYQLRIAKQVGLRIPRTIVSNDPVAIRKANSDFGPLVVKPARSGHFIESGEEFSIFTTLMTRSDLEELDDAKWAPSIYQEHIKKLYDIRVTVVGDKLYSAAIHSQTDPQASVDWRRTANPKLPHSVIELPPLVVTQLQALMGLLDLQFGCIDLILSDQGEYVFLEVNPSGQWLWLDDQLDLGISEGVAFWLAGRGEN
ncbi:hypothetical protein V476_21820 [Pseudomonas syringae KCTC 12500]|uniref:MvdC/MvdD family ATP grasp protein n=1 Tax=Pseudomonas syringae TaxID=317 RepID=UPI00046A50D9|nr:hypothetical protein [Pseudomonas syringae]KMY03619.1 hypothetical protein V476_21820 [Pseudomonas syringae KCTC 12500]POR85140.1 hypothetical protein BKM21_14050 [Pseudomonas syringae pv. syringae]